VHQISEAESAYVFSGSSLTPVFKRWSREVSPPELYNHGFENMESMGKIQFCVRKDDRDERI
jgi:hypothetical protein